MNLGCRTDRNHLAHLVWPLFASYEEGAGKRVHIGRHWHGCESRIWIFRATNKHPIETDGIRVISRNQEPVISSYWKLHLYLIRNPPPPGLLFFVLAYSVWHTKVSEIWQGGGGGQLPDDGDVPRVSQGSFFHEQMSRPVRRMAWSWCLPSRPLRVDCQWQKLFSVWSAWWLITSPSWGIKQTQEGRQWFILHLICTDVYLTCTKCHNSARLLRTAPCPWIVIHEVNWESMAVHANVLQLL